MNCFIFVFIISSHFQIHSSYSLSFPSLGFLQLIRVVVMNYHTILLHIRNPPNNQTITRLNPLPTAQSVGLCYSRMDSRPDRPYWHRNITFALFVLVILVRSLLSRSSKCVFGVLSSSSSSFVEIGVSAMSCVKVSGRTAVEESSISLWSDVER